MDSLSVRFKNDVFFHYLEFLKAQYRFHPIFSHAKELWEQKLTDEELLNGPYLEQAVTYAPGKPLSELPLQKQTTSTIESKLNGRGLYKHQTDALELLLLNKNAVIATGTSSGKTLCYQIPILDDLIIDTSPGLRAIIIYPLNALVNDQLNEWEGLLVKYPQIRFARFTGQTPDSQADYVKTEETTFKTCLEEEGRYSQEGLQRETKKKLQEKLRNDPSNRLNHRDDIRKKPPHILITNFSMLEYLLERPVDASIFENSRLKFLVLDEAHSYRGVQATEIAFLIRRIRNRLNNPKLVCIATSATLGKQGDVESEKKIRNFAGDLFSDTFEIPNPIFGNLSDPPFLEPSIQPNPVQYINSVSALRANSNADIRKILLSEHLTEGLEQILLHDRNLYHLRKNLLKKPALLDDVAQELWPGEANGKSHERARYISLMVHG